MKNKLKVFGIFSSFAIALTGLSFALVNKNAESENKKVTYEDFYEAVNEVEGVFDEVSAPVKLTPKNAYESDTLLDPIIKVQISDLSEEGKRSIRFVAAIPDLNLSAKFVRSMYDEEGNEFQSRKEYQVTEAYTSILAGSSSVLPSSFGEGYNYFVTYTMVNIPNDFWYHALDVDLVLEATTESNIKLESNGSNEANVEGLMTNYYESYFDYNELSDGTYEVSVKQDKRKDQNHHRHEIGNHKNERDENRPNIAKRGKEVTSIAANGFYGCEYMNEIVLPKYLNRIKVYAFNNCKNLKDVFFRGGLSNWLGITFDTEKSNPLAYANNFYVENKEEVTDIFIPKEINKIEEYAFYGMNNIKTVTFEEDSNCSEIGDGAFKDCFNLSSINIPEKVTRIKQNTFENCTSLAKIELPNALLEIGMYAFAGCSLLENITIPQNVNIIATCAFMHCTNLKEIKLSNHLSTIGDMTFYGCSSLNNIEIPEGVTEIKRETFFGCDNLENILLPNSLKMIGVGAFRECSSLKNISLPNNLISVDDYAFQNCGSLISIVIPEGIKELSPYIFYDCINLNQVLLPSTLITISEDAFGNCSSLTNLDLPSKLENIASQAFYQCSSLTSLTIPENVNIINSGVFWNCTSLKVLKILGSISNVLGYDSFGGTSIDEIYINDIVSWCEMISNYITSSPKLYLNNELVTNIEIPEGATKIGNNAFRGCSSLISIVLPSTINTIGNNAFINCINLEKVVFSSMIESIGNNAFENCTNLNTINLENISNSIGNYAFKNCTNLKSVVFSDDLANIGYGAFYSCSNIDEIIIPDSITEINFDTFGKCANLKSIVLSNILISIGDYAFYGCSNLSNINLPSTLQKIGSHVFYDCSSLKKIYIPKTVISISDWAFYHNADIIYCGVNNRPSSWNDRWNGHQPTIWGVTNDNYVEKEGVAYTIDSDGNAKVIRLLEEKEEIIIPKIIEKDDKLYNVTSIGQYSFYKNKNLFSIVLPEGIIEINSYSFYGCTNLLNVSLPSTLITIKNDAFNHCESLETIIIPENVISIGQDAFSSCSRYFSIYCNVSSKPEGWNNSWTSSNTFVYYAGEWEYVDGVPTPIV